MKRFLFFALSGAILFSMSLGLKAQEKEKKLTQDEATQLIQKYTDEETTLKPKYEHAKVEVKNLSAEVSKLDEEIKNLQDKIAELKKKVAERSIYVVKPGDWLSKLAEYKGVYGKGRYARWKEIYKANKDKIDDPNLIFPGWKLVIPRP